MTSHKRSDPAGRSSGNRTQQTTTVLRLREMLLNGQFQPGARMAELPLAAMLGVSRTPLRIALTTLEREGLLRSHPTRGFIVRAFSKSDILDAIEIRGLLEGMAARCVVRRIPQEPSAAKAYLQPLAECVAAIDHALSRLEADPAPSFQAYIEQNKLFHAVLLDMACSRVLTMEMERIVSLPFAAPSSAFLQTHADIPESRNILRIGQDQHHAILESLTERDLTRAERLLQEHSRLAGRNLEVAFRHHLTHEMLPGLEAIWAASA